jgi:hypothetical protein
MIRERCSDRYPPWEDHQLLPHHPRDSVARTETVVRLSLSKVVPAIFGAIILSVGASLALTYAKFHAGSTPSHLWRLFYVGVENNWPTWLSSFNLLACSLLLIVIGGSEWSKTKRDAAYFTALGLFFLYLSIDEAASIHEIATGPVQRYLGTSGALYSAWVIPAMAFVLLFVAAFLRFFLSLPRKYQVLFALAGALYVGGAIGGEMLSWHYRFPVYDPSDPGALDFGYSLLEHLEEACEMLGVGVFLSALLAYIADHRISLSLTVRS